MTGAGTADLAFAKESSFLGSLVDSDADGTPEYFEPGKDPTLQELTLQRALQRQRDPSNVWSSQSVAQNLEGAFGIQFTMDDSRIGDVHDIVFNDAGTGLTSGLAASSRWFLGLDYLSGTAERVLKGVVPMDFTVEYSQGGQIRLNITFAYADEEYNTSITPSSVQAANGASAQWHGMDLTIGGTTQVKEQSATLSISDMSRFQRGSEPIAVEAVVANPQATLDVTGIFSETNQMELAYGGSGQTTTSKTMSSVSGSMALSAAGATVTTYNFGQLKPNEYSWNELLGTEDTTEQVPFNIDGNPAVSIT
ncbi:phage tail tube protein [Halorussus sp. AFM4]|uniref:phage tail tube protein n=1 Tax=Halorussus sp. AFM4 TaxID=3421651 RepID=UPI003EBD7826